MSGSSITIPLLISLLPRFRPRVEFPVLDESPENAATLQHHIAGARLHVEDEKMSATSHRDELLSFARGQSASRVPRGRERLGGFESLAFLKLCLFRHRKTPSQAGWKSRAGNLTEF